MVFTDKVAAVAYAEDVLSKAGVADDAIGAIVAVLSDDATSLERVNITVSGDRAVSKLKALVKGQEGSIADGVAEGVKRGLKAAQPDLVGGITEAVSRLLKGAEYDMSSAGSTRAGAVLVSLGITEIDGSELYPLDTPTDLEECIGFPMHEYFNEQEATPAFKEWVEKQLAERNVLLHTKGGYAVRDLRSGDTKLQITCDDVTYKGFLDAGIVPAGVTGSSCVRHLRIAIELKYTQAQKDRYQKEHPKEYEEKVKSKKRKKLDDLSDEGNGVSYSAKVKGQAILELLACYAAAEYPLTLYLTDGDVFHRLLLVGKELRFWKNLGAKEALYWMTQDLAVAPSSYGFTFDADSSQLTKKQREAISLARKLQKPNSLGEQLDTVLPFLEEPLVKLTTALSLVQAHRIPMMEAVDMPQWLQTAMYS